MRLGLVGSLLVHTGVVAVALLLAVPGTGSVRGAAGAYLDIAPRVFPEGSPPPPAELTPPAAPAERVPAVPAEETPEAVEITETVACVPRPFRLRKVAKLATPLPVRRAAPAPSAARETPAPAPAPRPRVRQGELIEPRLVEAPAARYPSRARRLGWEGRVILELAVSARGTVDEVTVATSSGHAVLDRAAAEAARLWRFQPASRDGRPIAHTVRVPVDFALR